MQKCKILTTMLLGSLTLLGAGAAFGQDLGLGPRTHVDSNGIDGALVICGGGGLPASITGRFLELAGDDAARLVVIPTAAEKVNPDKLDSYARVWRKRGFSEIEVIHTRDRQIANTPEFVAPIRNATAVWFVGGQQKRLSRAYVGTLVEKEIYRLLERGGTVGGTSAGAAIQSQLMIAFGNPKPTLMQGLDLIPGTVIDQHF